ncbi:MAG: response regulator [Calditrichaeota bacterium]|nr:MAG: response regulator [Calditrichota bacterium]
MSEKLKICAIDDEQVILDSIVKLCGAEGWLVDTALDAKVGLHKLDTSTYDLIICDIMMPGIDGFEFLEQLRIKEIGTPVIITTGFSTLENAVKSLYRGAVDFLPKPFTFDELISIVGRGLKYSQIQRQVAKETLSSDAIDELIHYIPCPPKYKRLGYATWTLLEDDGSLKIGLTDLFFRTIGTLQQINLHKAEDEIFQGNMCAQIMTEDAFIHNILAPVSGRIIKRNEEILNNYAIIEKDPYFRGWVYSIVPANLDYETKYLIPCSSDRL